MGFSKALAMELGERTAARRTSSTLVRSRDRIYRVLAGRAEATGQLVDKVTKVALANQSVKSLVDADDIAILVLFLTGPHGRTILGPDVPHRRRVKVLAVVEWSHRTPRRSADPVVLEQTATDDHLLDVGGALADEHELDLSHQPLDLVLRGVAVPPVDPE